MHQGELRAQRDALESLWRQGLSGRALLQRHTELIDQYLVHCFEHCPEAREGMALVALGGYGRRELFPFSDVDVMLLHEPEAQDRLAAVTEAVFYPLWDAGLEVGHGVRTPAACLDDAGRDFFFQVALLDARWLAGSRPLFAELRERFQQSFVEGQRHRFFQTMAEHRQTRHRRFGIHSYLLEPHVKESRGGLRDIQALLWTAQAVFGLQDLTALEQAGLVTAAERTRFEEAWDSLIRMRNQLHYLSGRKNDQLYFEHQEEMAQIFGYRPVDNLLAVEQFMREVYGHLQTVAVTSDLFFEHVQDVLDSARQPQKAKALEPGLELRHGRIHLPDATLLAGKPHLLMRIFSQAARTGLPVHYRTKKLVSASLNLVTDRLRRSRRMAKAFLDMLTESDHLLPVLTAMHETGLLGAYLPEFRQVGFLAQHDVYHVYTVDRHLLQTVAELRELQQSEPDLFQPVASRRVLYLAALLHDLGKGQGSGHADRGAELAREIGARLGLSAAELDCLDFLVREHLFLMDTALRRDLEDEALIIRCARKIRDPERLSMLYLLSIADARATGPAGWSDWKAALLLELFLKISHLLERADLKPPNLNQGLVWMQGQVERLLDRPPALPVRDLPEDYLLSFSPETVVHHLSLRAGLRGEEALVVPTEHAEYWSVLILAKDRTGLLAKLCGTLALHNLEVMAAQIFTWPDQTAVDIMHVQPMLDTTFAEQDWPALRRDLNRVLASRLALAHRLESKRRHRLRRSDQAAAFRQPPQVEIDNRSSDNYTIIEVSALDRPGLLYEITSTLAELAIDIHRAKIATQAAHTIDVFYVQDSQGRKISDPDLQEEIRQSLQHAATHRARSTA